MKRYCTRTVRIGANKYNNFDPESALDKEIEYIYEDAEHIVNMTITPIIGTHEGLRLVDEYWIVYVYWYEEC
jgi:hypothetical protein